MNPLSLSQIAQLAGGSLPSGTGTVVIDKVSTDSRTIKRGELSLKLLNGSVYALAAGLALGVFALTVEGLRLMKAWTV